jgi:peroxiredoxin
MITELGRALEAEGIALVLVSVDEPAAYEAAANKLAELAPGRSSFVVEGQLGAFKQALNPRWKGAIPSTFLFSEGAELLYFWPGPVYEHEVANIVNAFLAGEPLEGPTYVEPSGPPG